MTELMYWVIDRFYARHPCRFIGTYPELPDDVEFRKGVSITASFPSPLVFELEPYNPQDSDQSLELLEYYKGTVPLFRDDVIEVLKGLSVNTLQYFPSKILDPDPPHREYTHYQAFNVVGTTRLEDLKNRTEPILRLEDSFNTIFVHEKLKSALLGAGFTAFEFNKAEDVAL